MESRKKIIKKLTDKYRLIIINANTFEEKVSFRISRLNVFVVIGVSLLVLVVSTIFFIAFTPLREYIPGYDSTALKKKATQLVYEVDSLKQVFKENDLYIESVKKALIGEMSETPFSKDSLLKKVKYNKDTMKLHPSKTDLTFREEIEREDRYSIFENTEKEVGLVFFAPVHGKIIKPYNYEESAYGIEVETSQKISVKSVADGTVVFIDFTASFGYVITIQHTQGFISIYKNNTLTHKKVGEIVKLGEAIAELKTTDKDKKYSILNFELWKNGYPVNPINYIDFKE